MESQTEESLSATMLEFSSDTFVAPIDSIEVPRARRAAPQSSRAMKTSSRSVQRRKDRTATSTRSTDLLVVLLAGLLLLLPLPSLLDSGNAFIGRLGLLFGLVIPPAAMLLLLQRRFGPGNKRD